MQQLKLFALVILVFTAVVATASAQKPPLRASDFNVEILNLDERPHVFALYQPPARAAYIAYVNLKRTSDWKPSQEVPAETGGLRLQFWLEGETARLEVTAYLGKVDTRFRPSEWENMTTTVVVSRALAEDEIVTIGETEKFGIKPFQVRTFRAQPWSVGPPHVTNKTQALTVDSVTEARPNYTLKIRNVSHKEIIAIHSYGMENDSKRGGSGLSGASLIPAGTVFVLNQRFDLAEERLRAKAQSERPRREIVIAAIVFSDGSFEGEPDVAAEMAADIAGQRLQFIRLMPLLRRLAASPAGERESLKILQKDIAALSQHFDPTIADELIVRFSAASEDMRNRRIKEEVANGMRSLKGHVLREIEKFEARREASSDVEVSQWLNELINDLERTIGQ